MTREELKATGDYAFPSGDGEYSGGPNHCYGMTLRDHFAGQALMAMGPEAIAALTNSVGDYAPGKVDGICTAAARMAYRFADAMLLARSPQVRDGARHD